MLRRKQKYKIQKRVIANNNIKAEKVRLINKDGKQAGVFSLKQALEQAEAANLDLIQITEKVDPPICKIMNFGKYLYQKNKKERQQKTQKTGEIKNIRLTLGISEHDMDVRKKAAEKFLNQGCKIRLEMRLRGREKAMAEFAKKKMKKIFDDINKTLPVKVEKELKREPRGFSVIITRDIKQKKDYENKKSPEKKV